MAEQIWIQPALTASVNVYDNQVLQVRMLPSFFFLDRKSCRRAAIIHHTDLAATCQKHCYMLSHTNGKTAVRDYRPEVWIIGERWDPIPGRFVELAEEIIAFIWNGHSAFIWVNGAEGEIFSCSLTLCQHVEKGWLPENTNSGEANPSQSAGVQSPVVR